MLGSPEKKEHPSKKPKIDKDDYNESSIIQAIDNQLEIEPIVENQATDNHLEINPSGEDKSDIKPIIEGQLDIVPNLEDQTEYVPIIEAQSSFDPSVIEHITEDQATDNDAVLKLIGEDQDAARKFEIEHVDEDLVTTNQLEGYAIDNQSEAEPNYEEHDIDNQSEHDIADGQIDLSSKFITDRVFETRKELIDWAKETGREVGTVIVTKKSDFVTGRTPRLLLGCERAGKYRPRKPGAERKGGKRKSTTKLCGCPFLMRGLYQLGTPDKWKVKVVCGRHNHPLVGHVEGKSGMGRLTVEERKIVEEMSASGLKLKQALTVIKSRNPTNASTIRHVYNARATLRKIETREKSQMHQLINDLQDNAYLEWRRYNEDADAVKDLFWAHPESVQLAKCFPHVFLVDSTYKTNRFKRSLFEIVGVTSTDQTYSVCFTLMEEEKEDDYVWALEKFRALLDRNVLPSVIVTNPELPLISGLEKVFPTTKLLFCRWHISKDIRSMAKKEIADTETFTKFVDRWQELMVAPSESEYDSCLRQLESDFFDAQTLLSYVKDVWLNPFKDRFVAAWTDLYVHLGNTSTNRAEGAHSRLKKQLNAANYDIQGMWKAMHPLINLQFTDIKASFEVSMKELQERHKVGILREVIGAISIAAMDYILKEKKRGGYKELDADACGCVLRRTHGLPCAHELIEYEVEGRAIPLSSIHSIWKKLSPTPDPPNRGDLDSRPEFHLFFEHFNESCEDRKVYLLKRLKELASPEEPTFVVSNGLIE
ncbi:hypothetical protein MKX01_000308 [Papaver californicum]|nr:hypothetical protein MKX01_000308 [Papaver californicum]